MLQLFVGTEHKLNVPLKMKIDNTFREINSILPLCMAKFELEHEGGKLKIAAIEPDASNPQGPINQIIYDLDNYIDKNGALIIRPKRDYLFNYYVNNGLTEERARTAFEHIDDIQMDIVLKVADALIDNGMLNMTSKELSNFNKLKDQWFTTTSVTLEDATYEIDYALDGNGVTMPKGIKSTARENAEKYRNILSYFRHNF